MPGSIVPISVASLPVIAPVPALIGMAVTPVPVVALLIAIQPALLAVVLAWMIVVPITVVGAIFVVTPAMIIAVFRIVHAGASRTASGGHRYNKVESENEWRYGVQYSLHALWMLARYTGAV
jgi:hypothetical protein